MKDIIAWQRHAEACYERLRNHLCSLRVVSSQKKLSVRHTQVAEEAKCWISEQKRYAAFVRQNITGGEHTVTN